jgi:major vault protein
MADDRGRDGDMVLAPNEYMYVSDQTKGNVDVFVGPTKQSLSNTDQPVRFDDRTKRFVPVDRDNAKQVAKTAPEGWYIVLKNPANNGKQPQSGQQGKLSSSDLDVGKKVIIPGPASFCLWPGQMAKILKGHHLRSNQYLLVRVYDEEEARKNWSQAVIKAATPSNEGADPQDSQDPSKDPPIALPIAENLTMGQVLVIKGTDVSFYIPPTGIEVIPDKDVTDDDGNAVLVREAVTLERLEYCLLMDESGNKRYERGPMVVFPKPTEVFVENEGARKFEAIELSDTSGIYVKVISAYEEGGKSYKVGEELFITGKEQMIYFPREEHSIIKYDNSGVHYSVAIPPGEARYVLDRNTGIVSLSKGPAMFLPDPRKQVIVRRILDYKTCSLLFPNNHMAFQHNARLAGVDVDTYMSQQGAAIVAGAAAAAMSYNSPDAMFLMSSGLESADMYSATRGMTREKIGSKAASRGLAEKASQEAVGNQFQRKTKYQEPRTITLSTKYDGAVALNIYTCYAMMLVRSNGERRVVQGPQTVLLEYDETPEVLELSTGKPKTTDNLLRTAYLRVTANKISDIIEIETKDFCRFELKLSYRMNFEGDPNNWFNVENHVKFLCDHMRSKLKNAARGHDVEEFYGNSTNIIRDVVLGTHDDEDDESERGFTFVENGMRVYDVEVLKVELKDRDIAEMIAGTQKETIKSAIKLASQRRELEVTRELEDLKQKVKEAEAATTAKGYELSIADAKLKRAADEKIIEAGAQTAAQRAEVELNKVTEQAKIHELNRKNRQADIAIEVEDLEKKQAVRIALLEAEVQAVVERAKAIGPDLIGALQAFGDAALTEKVATAMAPLAILGGTSVAEVINQLLAGTKLENVAKALAAKSPANPDPIRR